MMLKIVMMVTFLLVSSLSLASSYWIHLQCSNSDRVLRNFRSVEFDDSGKGIYKAPICWGNSYGDGGCCGYSNLEVLADEKFIISSKTAMCEGIPVSIDLNIPEMIRIPTFSSESSNVLGTFVASDYHSRERCGDGKLVLNLKSYPPKKKLRGSYE